MLKIYFVHLLMFSVFAVTPPEDNTPKYSKATVIEADTTGGDCAWLIKIENDYYKPKNLEKKFKKDLLEISVDYEPSLSKFHCEATDKKLDEIIVHWVNLRED